MSFIYRTYREGDEASLEALLKTTFSSFQRPNYWGWKYRSNPNFDPDLVVLLEKNAKLIGCNHCLSRDFKISSNLNVKAVLAADIAVDKAYRGLGLGTELVRYLRSSGVFTEKKILLSYMFTNPTLNKGLYQPVAGYIKLPSSSITYKKLFNCNKIQEKVRKMNQAINANPKIKQQFKELNIEISFKLEGSPEFTIKFSPEGIGLNEGASGNSTVIIEGKLPLSASIVSADVSTGELARAWLTGKVRVKKGIRNIFKLRKAFRTLKILA